MTQTIRHFAKRKEVSSVPNLMKLQLEAYSRFLQADVHYTDRENFGLEALLREIMESGWSSTYVPILTTTEGARYANTAAPLGTESSPIPPSAKASAQQATEPALAMSGPTTSAIPLSPGYWISASLSSRSTTSPAISRWR